MLPPIRFRFLELPRASAFAGKSGEYINGFSTYAEYNYLRGGLAAHVKAAHFEIALRVSQPWFGRANVIDFGCADGVFLPTLSRRFPHVLGVDLDPSSVETAELMASNLGLRNVELRSSRGVSVGQLRDRLGDTQYELLFLLETLEHIGEPERLYESRADFVTELFGLLKPDGVIIVSVPTMVGFPFLLQRLALARLGLHRDPLPTRDLLRAVAFRDTTRLEPGWTPETHLGFNHVRLLRVLRERMQVLRHESLFFSELFMLRQR